MRPTHDDVRVVTRLQTDPAVARMVQRRLGALVEDLGGPDSTGRATVARITSAGMSSNGSRIVVAHESVVLKLDIPPGTEPREGWGIPRDTRRHDMIPQFRLAAEAAVPLAERAIALLLSADPDNLRTQMLFEGETEARAAATHLAVMRPHGHHQHVWSPSPWSSAAVVRSTREVLVLPDAIEAIMPRTVLVAITGTPDRVDLQLRPSSFAFAPDDDHMDRLRRIAEMPDDVRTLLGTMP